MNPRLRDQETFWSSRMIRWYWHKFMQHIGYRKVWYFPTHHMCGLSNFWQWEYRPDLPSGVYRR